LRVFGVMVAVMCALWAVLPDPFPIVVDDLAAIVTAIVAAIQARLAGNRLRSAA
jgi:hypothetical protein